MDGMDRIPWGACWLSFFLSFKHMMEAVKAGGAQEENEHASVEIEID